MNELPETAEETRPDAAASRDPEDHESAPGADTAAEEPDEEQEPRETLLEQMGGLSGLVYSSVPVLVFVGVYLPTKALTASIWSAVGSSVLILIWRLVRREKIQPAISGVFGVAVAAFISYETGSARGYFLYGIWVSLLFGGAFAASILARWPLAGVVWSKLNGTGMAWRSDKVSRRYYDVATVVWVLVFGARFVVQHWLYAEHAVGWLGAARIAMGWPLTGIAALVTIWAVRKADHRHRLLTAEQPQEA